MTNAPQQQKQETIFWIETESIKTNPHQPRKDFNDEKINELAQSIKQYGILQPLVVSRQEKEIPSGTVVEYELIAGERRLRAAKLLGLQQIPVIIKDEPAEKIKLELALVENIQRENLNAMERAYAFKELVDKFNYTEPMIAKNVSKSRPYVANTMRLFKLPASIQKALLEGKINEGHTRPLLMLAEQPEEQQNLFETIVASRMNVRDAEAAGRRLASHRARKKEFKIDLYTKSIEEKLKQILGARVSIERRGENGGRISFDFFSEAELQNFLQRISTPGENEPHSESSEPLILEPQLVNNSIPLDHDLLEEFTI